jgi:hypothetical protein
MPFKSRLERMSNKDFSIVFAVWVRITTILWPSWYVWDGNGNNHTSYSSAAYDEFLDKVRKELDLRPVRLLNGSWENVNDRSSDRSYLLEIKRLYP